MQNGFKMCILNNSMKLAAILIIAAMLVSGCTQGSDYANRTGSSQNNLEFNILDYVWAFQDDCQYGNKSVAYAKTQCDKNMMCEVYVNDIRSNYGQNGLQECSDQIAVAELETNVKPEFVAIQSGDKYYYTRRDRSKNVEICCSFLDPTTNALDREEEICQTIRVEAQCPEFLSKGFSQLTLTSWQLFYDGTLEIKLKNEVGQDIVIRKFYINDRDTNTDYTTVVTRGNYTPTITVTGGPRGSLGSSYNISLAVEYSTFVNSSARFNSSGTLVGMYS
jgi:hypothetical protein